MIALITQLCRIVIESMRSHGDGAHPPVHASEVRCTFVVAASAAAHAARVCNVRVDRAQHILSCALSDARSPENYVDHHGELATIGSCIFDESVDGWLRMTKEALQVPPLAAKSVRRCPHPSLDACASPTTHRRRIQT